MKAHTNLRLELSSIWALLAAFEDPLLLPANVTGSPFEGTFVKVIDSVSWMVDKTKKLLDSKGSGPYCWTFFSIAAFGKRNKVPQVRSVQLKGMSLEGFNRDFNYWRTSYNL